MTRGDTAVETALRRAAAAGGPPPASPEAVARGVEAAGAALRGSEDGRLRAWALWGSVLETQLRLFPPAVRVAALVVLLLGVPLALVSPGAASTVLDLAAPALAAVGVLAAFGGTRRASLEVELACAVRPYELLLARLILVVGCDLATALLASLALVLGGGAGAAVHLILTWFGPLLLLAGLNLALSIRWGAVAAAVPTCALWSVVVAATATAARPHAPVWRWLAPAHMPTSALVACSLAGAVLLVLSVARGAAWVAPRGDAA